jgi:hypothetical protein
MGVAEGGGDTELIEGSERERLKKRVNLDSQRPEKPEIDGWADCVSNRFRRNLGGVKPTSIERVRHRHAADDACCNRLSENRRGTQQYEPRAHTCWGVFRQ